MDGADRSCPVSATTCQVTRVNAETLLVPRNEHIDACRRPSGRRARPNLDSVRAAPETPHPYDGCAGAGGTEPPGPIQGVVVEHPAAVRVGAHLEPFGRAV